MAKDPAVSSIECDCLVRADMSLPESDSSSLGGHDMDQVEAATRRLSVHVGAPWGIDRIDGVIDNTYDDGDLTGKGVRVYIVDTGVQGSHDDFGGRVVNGHTVRPAPVAACTRPLPVPPVQPPHTTPPAYSSTPNPWLIPSLPRATPPPHLFLFAGPRARRVRLVPSCQRHPPRQRHWVQRARHPCGLDCRRPKARRCQECDACAGFLVLSLPMPPRRVSSNPNPNPCTTY